MTFEFESKNRKENETGVQEREREKDKYFGVSHKTVSKSPGQCKTDFMCDMHNLFV